jgi:hypothetical protein
MKKIVLFLFSMSMFGFSKPDSGVSILTPNPPPSSIRFAYEECYIGYRVFITYPTGCGEVAVRNSSNTIVGIQFISCPNSTSKQVSFLLPPCQSFNVRFSTPSMIGTPYTFTTPCGYTFPCLFSDG